MEVGSFVNLLGFFLIVAIVEVLKKLDKNNKLKNLYVVLPLFVSIPIGILFAPIETIKEVCTTILIYASFSAYGYDILKKIFNNFLNNLGKNIFQGTGK